MQTTRASNPSVLNFQQLSPLNMQIPLNRSPLIFVNHQIQTHLVSHSPPPPPKLVYECGCDFVLEFPQYLNTENSILMELIELKPDRYRMTAVSLRSVIGGRVKVNCIFTLRTLCILQLKRALVSIISARELLLCETIIVLLLHR